ncbi:MAG: methyltransferase domain-containing protein [Gammaproteobacteria bacterium]|nr:methyltransferase domain-containing protein [Gammaproteobacteria bacterium]NIR84841.1 methyltransferase domain-containing protein [Gammaproteobacteria bacterium]NIR91555.1 methyltransferase domain-containing protein [Gammaproteobacteria bacterium]NIU05888.1 methyltransferase domain-containing protein [Gammaproteobacteria bacterium]NIV76743.1 methyltransferase domain-containing protein [Gammaproteobacteria bacterium]
MTTSSDDQSFYSEDLIAKLELRWGEGFLSPGGAEELALMLEGVPVHDATVLDFGCGTGGIDVLLAREHGAGKVVGVDIEPLVLEHAAKRVADAGLSDRITFQRVNEAPLPLRDGDFEVVFTKDSIVHIADKQSLFADFWRLLWPGGYLVLGDWFRSAEPYTEEMRRWATEGDETFEMGTLADAADLAARAGFEGIETVDRNEWFQDYAQAEYDRITGPLWQEYVARFGEEGARASAENSRIRALLAKQGQLRPGHLRARKALAAA